MQKVADQLATWDAQSQATADQSLNLNFASSAEQKVDKEDQPLSLIDLLFPKPTNRHAKVTQINKSELIEQSSSVLIQKDQQLNRQEPSTETQIEFKTDRNTIDIMARLASKDHQKHQLEKDTHSNLKAIIESLVKKAATERDLK